MSSTFHIRTSDCISNRAEPRPLSPGDAFGEGEAGPEPKATAVETDVTKALRTSGFPEVEGKALASTLTNKILGAIQKRVVKLDECSTNLAKSDQTSLVSKKLFFLVKNVLGLIFSHWRLLQWVSWEIYDSDTVHHLNSSHSFFPFLP